MSSTEVMVIAGSTPALLTLFNGVFNMLRVVCQALRPTTNSTMTIMIPYNIGTDPYDCAQWVGEEFDWQFIPMSYKILQEK